MRTIISLLAAAAAFVLIPLANSGQAEQSGPTPTVEHLVMPGETLWDLAADMPGVDDRREAVHKLMELNGLPNGSLQAGQRILIPAASMAVSTP